MKAINNIFDQSFFRGCILIVLICSFNISNATTVTSVQGGNWDAPATWDCACEPNKKDNVIISSGDIVILTDDIKIKNLTIESTAILDVSISNYEISIEGNWINNGIFIQRSAEVIFRKKQDAIIGGSNSTTFYDLTIDKKGKTGVTLTAPITVTHILTLKKGILYTDDTNYITMETGAIMIDASDKSHIDGRIKIKTDTIERIVIGTGKNGKHKKIAIDVNSTDTSVFIVEYFDNAFFDTTYGPGINHLITKEYWQLFRTSGSANVSVTLYWDVNSGNGPMHHLSNALVARFNNAQWVDAGNAAITWNPASIMSDSLNSCGYFTFGCSNTCGHGNDDDDDGDDEGDDDGMGKKGSGSESSDSPDDEVVSDSKYESFNTISENNAVEAFGINVRPNPSRSDKLCIDIIGEKSREVLIVVVDLLGREYYSKVCVLEGGKYTLAVDPYNKLAPGVYMIIATSMNELYKKKVVIQ